MSTVSISPNGAESWVIFWDIDGTLLRSNRSGAFIDYLKPVMVEIFGTAGDLGTMEISGMTDMQIIFEALREHGFTAEQVFAQLPALEATLPDAIRRAVERHDAGFDLLPGVTAALEALAHDPRYLSTLVTGNIELAADVKLELVGIGEYFKLRGAYGSDSMNRLELPAIAAQRVNEERGLSLSPDKFIVIGDTPNDIACAQYFGARSIAVATGRSFSADDLRQHSPDSVLNDLSDLSLFRATLAQF
jgi:phosphoglycolate phosphatase-like HAD superfamily hydrolase